MAGDVVTETLKLVIELAPETAGAEKVTKKLQELAAAIEAINNFENKSASNILKVEKAYAEQSKAIEILSKRIIALEKEKDKLISKSAALERGVKKEEIAYKQALKAQEKLNKEEAKSSAQKKIHAEATKRAEEATKRFTESILKAKKGNKDLGEVYKNQDLLLSRYARQTKQLEATENKSTIAIRKKVLELRKADLSVKKTAQGLTTLIEKNKRVAESERKVAAALDEARKKAKSFREVFDTLSKEAKENTAAFNEFSTALGRINQDLQTINQPLASFAKGATAVGIGLTSIAAGFAGFAVKEAAEFELEMQNINTLLIGIAEQDLPKIQETILEMSTTIPLAANDMARAFYFIQSATSLGAQALHILEAATKGAVAGFTTTEIAADGITTVLNAYNLAATEAAYVTDVLFATVVKGKLTFDQLSTNIGSVAAVAKLSNTSLEELTALIAALTKGTGQVEKSITSLRAGMVSVISPTDRQADAFRRFGIDLADANGDMRSFADILKDISDQFKSGDLNVQKLGLLFPQVRALRGIAVLASNWKLYSESLALTNKAAGQTEIAFDKMINTLGNQSKILTGNLERLVIELGLNLRPALIEVIGAGINLARALRDLNAQANITGSSINQVIGPALKRVADATNELATNLPDIFAGLDFTGFKQAIESLLGVADIDFSSVQDITKAFQTAIDAGEGLIKFFDGLIDVAGFAVSAMSSAIDSFNDMSDVSKTALGTIGGLSIIFDTLSGRVGSFTAAIVSLGVQIQTLRLMRQALETVNSSTTESIHLFGSLTKSVSEVSKGVKALAGIGAFWVGWEIGGLINKLLDVDKTLGDVLDRMWSLGDAGSDIENKIRRASIEALGLSERSLSILQKTQGINLAQIINAAGLQSEYNQFLNALRTSWQQFNNATNDDIRTSTLQVIRDIEENFRKEFLSQLGGEVSKVFTDVVTADGKTIGAAMIEAMSIDKFLTSHGESAFIKMIQTVRDSADFRAGLKALSSIIESEISAPKFSLLGVPSLTETVTLEKRKNEAIKAGNLLLNNAKESLLSQLDVVDEINEKVTEGTNIKDGQIKKIQEINALNNDAIKIASKLAGISFDQNISVEEIVNANKELVLLTQSITENVKKTESIYASLRKTTLTEEEAKAYEKLQKAILKFAGTETVLKKDGKNFTAEQILQLKDVTPELKKIANQYLVIKKVQEELGDVDILNVNKFNKLRGIIEETFAEEAQVRESFLGLILDREIKFNKDREKEYAKSLDRSLKLARDVNKKISESELVQLQQTISEGIKLRSIAPEEIAEIEIRIRKQILANETDLILKETEKQLKIKIKAFEKETRENIKAKKLQRQIEVSETQKALRISIGKESPTIEVSRRDAEEFLDTQRDKHEKSLNLLRARQNIEAKEIGRETARAKKIINEIAEKEKDSLSEIDKDRKVFAEVQLSQLEKRKNALKAFSKLEKLTISELANELQKTEKDLDSYTDAAKISLETTGRIATNVEESINILRERLKILKSEITERAQFNIDFNINEAQREAAAEATKKVLQDKLNDIKFNPKVELDETKITDFGNSMATTLQKVLQDTDPTILAKNIGDAVRPVLQEILDELEIGITTNVTAEPASKVGID
jgi:TP901 family phage tail tape measure protein